MPAKFIAFLLLMLCAESQAFAQNPAAGEPRHTPVHGPLTVSFLPVDPPPLLTGSGSVQQAPAQTLPEHTGLPALWHATLSDFGDFPRRKSTWAILVIGAVGAVAIHPLDDSVNARLTGNPTVTKIFGPGKYLGGWVQAGSGVGAYLVGRYLLPPEGGTEHTNKVAHIGFDLVRAQILTQAFTYAIKLSVRRDRPTGECCAFPSGHSATTFATAAVLERHLGFRGAWPTVLIASYVAASRLHDNRHFASDVAFGAALGTATGWTVVGRHGRSNYAWIPVPVKGGMALMLVSQN